MTSRIEVNEKTVNNRDVISFSKQYGDEEHEVFAPKEHGTQVLLSMLAILNEGKDDDDRFVLARKGDIGHGDVESVNEEMVRVETVRSVVEQLFDDELAQAVSVVLEGNGDE